MDHYQAAEIFSDVLGRKIEYKEPDDDSYRQVMTERGFSDEYISAMIQVFGKIRNGQVDRISYSVREILGRDPINLKDYVEESRRIFE
jgi:hypothetical protein